MKRWCLLSAVLIISLVVVSSSGSQPGEGTVPPLTTSAKIDRSQVKIEKNYAKMPLIFVPNQGQIDKQVYYYIQGKDITVYFTPEGLTYSLSDPAEGQPVAGEKQQLNSFRVLEKREPSQPSKRWVVKLNFVGARKDAKPEPLVQSGTKISYFKGKKKDWKTGLQAAAKIRYRNLWTGKAVAGPRSEFDSVLAREESQNPGIYFLTGFDPETGKSSVYIGEAESIRDRVKGLLDKDFWNHLVFFISKDENLTKAHIRFLEGRLIEQAKQASRADVKNNQGSGARLPESDREDMEIFLEKIHQLLPVLGVEVLVPTIPGVQGEAISESLFCEVKGVKATGYLTPNGIVVIKGSQAVLHDRPSSHKYPWPLNLRKKLKDEGALKEEVNFLLFPQDIEFSSPSAAASVVHGGHTNGLIVWKNKDGKTLKELESV